MRIQLKNPTAAYVILLIAAGMTGPKAIHLLIPLMLAWRLGEHCPKAFRLAQVWVGRASLNKIVVTNAQPLATGGTMRMVTVRTVAQKL